MTIYQMLYYLYEVSTVVELCSRKIGVNLLITLFSKKKKIIIIEIGDRDNNRDRELLFHMVTPEITYLPYFLRKCHCVNRPLFSDIIIIYYKY